MIDVVIVTYNDRWKYLQRVLEYLNKIELIGEIVLVDNNSITDYRMKLELTNAKKITVLKQNSNTGSAKGFSIGIQYLINNGATNWIYLLDDDNLPEPDTFDVLSNAIQSNRNSVYATVRRDREYMVKAIDGVNVKYLFPEINTFMGFGLFSFLSKSIFKSKKISSTDNTAPVVIPMAPYGGLLFDKSIIKNIGLPNEQFYIYVDDFDFTYRITEAGYKIELLKNAFIVDLEKSWITQKASSPIIRIINTYDSKAFLNIRNGSYFSFIHLKKSALIYLFNKYILLSHAFLYSIFHSKLDRFKYIMKLIKEGESGHFNNNNFK